MSNADTTVEDLRARAIKLLTREARPVHTGEIALLLQVPTHQVHTALHHPYQAGKVRFISSEGWSLTPAAERSVDGKQERLA